MHSILTTRGSDASFSESPTTHPQRALRHKSLVPPDPFSPALRKNPSAEYVETRGYCPPDDRCKIVPCYTSFDRRKKLRNMVDHGDLTMRKHSHLFLSLLVPAVFVLGGYAVVKAQQEPFSAVKS